MSHPLEGVVKVVTATAASGGAGYVYVPVRPPEGCVWEIDALVGFQDDGAVTEGWYVTDTKESITRQNMVTCTGAASTYLPFYALDDAVNSAQYLVRPFVVTYQTYVEFGFNASAGGKNGYIRAVVREYRGVEPKV